MPLRDHFHPPLHPHHHWESFHSNWATRIADQLNEKWLPPEFLAEEYTSAGTRMEIDIATFEEATQRADATTNGAATATVATRTYAPPAPNRTMAAVFPDSFEVRVFSTTAGRTLVAAIELISPGNKDRPQERRAFASKCLSYLQQGISLVIIDVVTNRRANLHNETMRLMEAPANLDLAPEIVLYSVAYRPVTREDRSEIDLWSAQCAVGQPLPSMPLRLTGDLFVPVEFEVSYEEACRKRRLA